ncbi:MAG: hypothetical protein HY291_13925 [Planctomycetes bacterium]|nr:hypothetical protein [Planctomycetota bacterium]
MDETPQAALDERPPAPEGPPLSRGRALLGVWLGLLGMVVYLFALHLSVTRRLGLSIQIGGIQPLSQTCPLVASLGCVLLIAAILIVWRVRLSSLLILAAASGFLLWIVVAAQEITRWR